MNKDEIRNNDPHRNGIPGKYNGGAPVLFFRKGQAFLFSVSNIHRSFTDRKK